MRTSSEDVTEGSADEELPPALRAAFALIGVGLALSVAAITVLAVFGLLLGLVESVDAALLNVALALSVPAALTLGGVLGRRAYRGQLAAVRARLLRAPARPPHSLAGGASPIAVAASGRGARPSPGGPAALAPENDGPVTRVE